MKKLSLISTLNLITPLSLVALFFTPTGFAQQWDGETQDMSDPLAVYTQAGVGVANQGINLKIGNAYDTGDIDTMAMNIVELKGVGGDSLGLDGNNSINNLRFRNFNLDKTNGRGSQVDVNWDFNTNLGSASYSFIQALPALGPLQLYPLAGIGVTLTDTAVIRGDENPVGSVGYAIPSSFAVVGTYAKIAITDKIWLNYNPMYMTTLNSNQYMSDMMDGFYHEVVASYQINPRQNIRFFVNYAATEFNKDNNIDWRIEFNHQF
ncbi:hypothetical protein HWQ46_02460 [Shewanella sp. D64]|uniref:hypothetical protein n=1 Tax=unclassified Shewanella TaxID=196818 RepID=UPI0022BA5841|nr:MULTISPECIES: hypothetical protein [unclassified Shewanella]MEC4724408.1 hypothetical protein [Shewanella sp. D64]MEC4736815.1 hypothetical protein [Shewanella sp. E94]WBJ94524.1 hypothetical protein HWQ47_22100 [Shewanella sp. MTB7]